MALVGSFREAQAASIRLWGGTSQDELDRVLRTLDDANIASHYKASVNTKPRLTIFGTRGKTPG